MNENDPPPPEADELSMPLGDHLEELRGRLLRCIVAVGAGFIVAWFFRLRILDFLLRPHRMAMQAHRLAGTINYQNYLEAITPQLKACVLAALVVMSPYVLYQMWKFIAPGLYKHERSVIARVGTISMLCFAAGLAFGYLVFIPIALRFLLGLAGPQMKPVLMISPYLSMLLLMTLALGVVFQTPVVMYHLVKWDIVEVEAIQRQRKMAILAGFVIGAFFTPPDPFTQMMMAVPLVMLYDLGALAAAPSRQAMLNFLRFAGAVALIAGAVLAYFFLWPVGRLTTLQGQALLGGREVPRGQSARLRRSTLCRLPEGSAARISFGSTGRGVLVAGPARLKLHGSGTLGLERGDLYVRNEGGDGPIEVRSEAARIALERGEAEITSSEPETITVTVVRGRATAETQGRTVHIRGGHSRSFHRGGEPAEVEGIMERWRRLEESAPPGKKLNSARPPTAPAGS